MRQETVGVTENLLKSATEEFLEKGFMKASLRNISAKSGDQYKFYLYSF